MGPSTPQRAGVDPGDQPSWGVLGPSLVEAQEVIEPLCNDKVCVANCLADIYFLGHNLSSWRGWYYTFYNLLGCDDPTGQTAAFLVDIAADMVGAAGAPTMQCWQGVTAQKSVCSSRGLCKNNDCGYAPNVCMSLDPSGEGYTAITVDTDSYTGCSSEKKPNAYSRDFNTYFYLSYEEGQKLLLEKWDVDSLSYPNWITRGGWSHCHDDHGVDDPGCKLLVPFVKPSSLSHSLDWGDGGLINLEGFTKDAHGIDSSPSDGYIALKSDDDSITIKKEHGLSAMCGCTI